MPSSPPFEFAPLTIREKAPKPLFANTPKKQKPIIIEKVPVLDNWTINKKEQFTGIISNSPNSNEREGKSVTTREVATDMAFVMEGFTIETMDGRKYKLGMPKKKDGNDTNEEVVVYRTPTLIDWDLNDDNCIVGIMKGTNDRNVPNGQEVTTDVILTSVEFLQEGYSVVSASGITYKLGRRDKTGMKRKLASVIASAPERKVQVLVPSFYKTMFSNGKKNNNGRNVFYTARIDEWSTTGMGGVTGSGGGRSSNTCTCTCTCNSF